MKRSTIIIGSGWAGLAAATELVSMGHSVSLLESARQAGGRARTVDAMHNALDNGQHLMLGAYQNFLALLNKIGVKESSVLLRLPLELQSVSCQQPGNRFTLRTPNLPAPLHLLWALVTAKGLGIRDKWSAIRLWQALQKVSFRLEQDIPLGELFQQFRQSQQLVQKLWEPLCVAALNTPVEKASAQIFITVLHRSFTGNPHNSDLLLPIVDLGKVLPEPATRFIRNNGGKIFTEKRVTGLVIENRVICAVQCNDEIFTAENVVLATSPRETLRLIQHHDSLSSISSRMETFTYEPIYTLYLKYPATLQLPSTMLGILGGTAQWIIDRSICGQNGILAVVISANGPHELMDAATLTGIIHQEISTVLPDMPAPLDSFLIREKRATFSCTPRINLARPENRTPVKGLWLAGDYTRTDLPATLEGAIQSGVQCATHILSSPD